jgi:hypothetical protein
MQLVNRTFSIANFDFSFRNWQFIALLGLLVLISVPGCRKSSGAVPVHGHVSSREKPFADGAVTFYPDSGRPVIAAISNGDYATELVPADYVVVVNLGGRLPKGYKEGDPVPPPEIALPDVYTNRVKSTLKATVKAGQSESIDFELK